MHTCLSNFSSRALTHFFASVRAGFAHGSWWKKLNQGNKFAEEFKFYEGSFKDNAFHGKGKIFYSDDTTKEGEWHEGEFVSEKS